MRALFECLSGNYYQAHTHT